MSGMLRDVSERCGTSAPPAAPGNDLISMLAHGAGTQNMPAHEYSGQHRAAHRRRQRHDPQQHHRQRARAESESRSVSEITRASRARAGHGLRNHPLANTARSHASHRRAGRRARRQSRFARATKSSCGTSRAIATRPSSSAPTNTSSAAPKARQHLSFGYRHSSLRRQSTRRDAAADHLGRDLEALPARGSRRRARTCLFDIRARLSIAAGQDSAPALTGQPVGELSHHFLHDARDYRSRGRRFR